MASETSTKSSGKKEKSLKRKSVGDMKAAAATSPAETEATESASPTKLAKSNKRKKEFTAPAVTEEVPEPAKKAKIDKTVEAEKPVEETPTKAEGKRKKKAKGKEAVSASEPVPEVVVEEKEVVVEVKEAKPAPKKGKKKAAKEAAAAPVPEEAVMEVEEAEPAPKKGRKKAAKEAAAPVPEVVKEDVVMEVEETKKGKKKAAKVAAAPAAPALEVVMEAEAAPKETKKGRKKATKEATAPAAPVPEVVKEDVMEAKAAPKETKKGRKKAAKEAASPALAPQPEVVTEDTAMEVETVKETKKGKKKATKSAAVVVEEAMVVVPEPTSSPDAEESKKSKKSKDAEPAPASSTSKAAPKKKGKKGKAPTPEPEPESASEEEQDEDEEDEMHLHGFSTDDDDSSDDEDAMDDEPSAFDVGKLPTVAKDDATVKRKLEKAKRQPTEDRGVLFLGRLPHGFYEDQLKAYFSQFGNVTRLRLSRNKRTGKSKHYGFIEFDSSSVAQIVAETMDNYLLMGHILRCKLVPKDEVHPELWVGANRKWRVVPHERITKDEHDRLRTEDEQAKAAKRLVKRENQRKRKLEASGIKYDFEDVSYKKAKETPA